MKRVIYLAILIGFMGCEPAIPSKWKLASPNGDIAVSLALENGLVYYDIKSNDSLIVGKSQLGIILSSTDLSSSLSFFSASEIQTNDEEITFLTGKEINVRDHFNHQVISFQNTEKSRIGFEVRVYDDGVALRSILPDSSTTSVEILQDKMQYNLSHIQKSWIQPYDTITTWSPEYQRFYLNGIEPSTPSTYNNGWCFPALFQDDEKWLLLSEGGVGYTSGTHLDNKNGGSIYSLKWAEPGESMGAHSSIPKHTLPYATSWKTFAIGDLQSIVASNLVRQVSEPQKLKDIDWIKPGRASWSWLSDHKSPRDFDALKKFVDLSANMGWEYSLVDANWNEMKGGDITQLVNYANEKKVGLFLWYNSGGPHNDVPEQPRNRMNIREKRIKEMKWMQELGIKGIKVDFWGSDKQYMMNYYQELLEDAAEYKLLVNFHGCTMPRGWSRTYPNLMTMESVRGGEFYTFGNPGFEQDAPLNNTIWPFTRNVVGSMDYTPVIFTDQLHPHITTYAHELALSVLYESGIVHLADDVSGYYNLSHEAQELLQELPATWDEIKYISGYPGSDIVLARRKGTDWFIAGINGQETEKKWSLDLSFLSEDCELTIFQDGSNDMEIIHSKQSTNESLNISALPYGGFLIRANQQPS